MAYTKEVTKYIDVDVDVQIEFEDLIGYIKKEGLTDKELTHLRKAVKQETKQEILSIHSGTTLMDEIAFEELQEWLKEYGAESIMRMVKAGHRTLER